jgi:acetyl esterase/lipase
VIADRPHDEAALRTHIGATPMGDGVDAMRGGFAARLGPQPDADVVAGGLALGQGPTVLWFHGGGYVMGGPQTHVLAARGIAATGLRVVLPRYRLAPEHRWPAMLDDALAAIDAVEGPLALGGDSAGGHLALVAALHRPGRAAALAVIAPNTDRTGRSTTRGARGDAMNDGATDAALWRMAAPDLRDDHPDASPLLADLGSLPPLHVEVAGAEVLLDDGLLLAAAAARQGVAVSLHVTPALFHLFPLWPDALPSGASAVMRIGAFLKAGLG